MVKNILFFSTYPSDLKVKPTDEVTKGQIISDRPRKCRQRSSS
ncbi:MAG: hypothetical protein QNJ37_09560 [Crocosphaera sp.]|nr:hypothetical protein [Crocosphaera sp.]